MQIARASPFRICNDNRLQPPQGGNEIVVHCGTINLLACVYQAGCRKTHKRPQPWTHNLVDPLSREIETTKTRGLCKPVSLTENAALPSSSIEATEASKATHHLGDYVDFVTDKEARLPKADRTSQDAKRVTAICRSSNLQAISNRQVSVPGHVLEYTYVGLANFKYETEKCHYRPHVQLQNHQQRPVLIAFAQDNHGSSATGAILSWQRPQETACVSCAWRTLLYNVRKSLLHPTYSPVPYRPGDQNLYSEGAYISPVSRSSNVQGSQTCSGEPLSPSSHPILSTLRLNSLAALEHILTYLIKTPSTHRIFQSANQLDLLLELSREPWPIQAAVAILREGPLQLRQVPPPSSPHTRHQQRKEYDADRASHEAEATYILLSLLALGTIGGSIVTDAPWLGSPLQQQGPLIAFGLPTLDEGLSAGHDIVSNLLDKIGKYGMGTGQQGNWDFRIRPELEAGLKRLAFLCTGHWDAYEDSPKDRIEGLVIMPYLYPIKDKPGAMLPATASLMTRLSAYFFGLYPASGAVARRLPDSSPFIGIGHVFRDRTHFELYMQARISALVGGSPDPTLLSAVVKKARQVLRHVDRADLGLTFQDDCQHIVGQELQQLRFFRHDKDVPVVSLVYTCTWEWLHALHICAISLTRSSRKSDLELAARIWEFLLDAHKINESYRRFTVGIRAWAWASLITVCKRSIMRNVVGLTEERCLTLRRLYQKALSDKAREIQGGAQQVMLAKLLRLTQTMRYKGWNVDTSPDPADMPKLERTCQPGDFPNVYCAAQEDPYEERLLYNGKKDCLVMQRGAGRLRYDGGQTVEEVALNAYVKLGYQGIFSECRAFKTLFLLLLWEQLADFSIPGAFPCPHIAHLFPLDFDHGTMFYNRRQHFIKHRLADLRLAAQQKRLGTEVRMAWEAHHDELLQLEGRWLCDGLKREDAVAIAIGLAECGLLTEILLRLSMHHKAWQVGLPDLVLWGKREEVASKGLPVGGKATVNARQKEAWPAAPLDKQAKVKCMDTAYGGLKVEELGGLETPQAQEELFSQVQIDLATPDLEDDRGEGNEAGERAHKSESLGPSQMAIKGKEGCTVDVNAPDEDIVIKLVEVKSKNDHLSESQKVWISRFVHLHRERQNRVREGIPRVLGFFELCHVRSLPETS